MNDTNRAAAEIMAILVGLPSPRHAAAAIATVRANLFLQGGGDTVQKVARMMDDDDRAVIEVWETITHAIGRSPG